MSINARSALLIKLGVIGCLLVGSNEVSHQVSIKANEIEILGGLPKGKPSKAKLQRRIGKSTKLPFLTVTNNDGVVSSMSRADIPAPNYQMAAPGASVIDGMLFTGGSGEVDAAMVTARINRLLGKAESEVAPEDPLERRKPPEPPKPKVVAVKAPPKPIATPPRIEIPVETYFNVSSVSNNGAFINGRFITAGEFMTLNGFNGEPVRAQVLSIAADAVTIEVLGKRTVLPFKPRPT